MLRVRQGFNFVVSCWVLRKKKSPLNVIFCHVIFIHFTATSTAFSLGDIFFPFCECPWNHARLSVNQPVAGGNPRCIAVTTERVANSGSGFEFLCAALRKKAPLQMRRDNLFLTEFPMKNRCSYFRISSLSKNSQPLSLALSMCRLIALGLGLMALSHRSFPALTRHPWLSENTFPSFISPSLFLSSRPPLVIKNLEKTVLKSEQFAWFSWKPHYAPLLYIGQCFRNSICIRPWNILKCCLGFLVILVGLDGTNKYTNRFIISCWYAFWCQEIEI